MSIDGAAYLNAMQVHGNVEIGGAHFKDTLILDGTSIKGQFLCGGYPTSDPVWHFAETRIGNCLRAETIEVAGCVGVVSTVESSERYSYRGGRCAVSFAGSKIGGDMFFNYDEIHVDEMLGIVRAESDNDSLARLDGARITDEICSKSIEILGGTCLDRIEIGGRLILNGVDLKGHLSLRASRVRAGIECRQGGPALGRSSVMLAATLEGAEINSDVDLTGLEVEGDLNLGKAFIGGRLRLHEGTRHALVRGDLLMGAARVSEMIVSGPSFPECATPKSGEWREEDALNCDLDGVPRFHASPRGVPRERASQPGARVVLERATIGKLELIKPLPGVVDLSGLQVGSWDEHADFFEGMLLSAQPFRKSNYLAIESHLRNKGRDSYADQIHVLMRRAERAEMAGRGRRGWDWLLDFFTGYGTHSSRLALIIFFSFLLCIGVFAAPMAVEYSAERQLGEASDKMSPELLSERLPEAFFLSVGLHVPIVSLGIDERVQPRGFWRRLYALIVTAASWVAWPLFIASVSGLLRQRK